jgi:hypothetical protein
MAANIKHDSLAQLGQVEETEQVHHVEQPLENQIKTNPQLWTKLNTSPTSTPNGSGSGIVDKKADVYRLYYSYPITFCQVYNGPGITGISAHRHLVGTLLQSTKRSAVGPSP